jgi:Flp pilus assembly protein TadD
MARCYRLSGAVDSAVSLLNQAKARESGNADVYKELGATFQVRGMPNEALEAYGQYLALVPNAADKAEVEAVIRKIQSGDLSFEK